MSTPEEQEYQRLLEQQMLEKEREMEVLQELSQEAGFRPRASLQRTPPHAFSSPPPPPPAEQLPPTAKRPLASPQEVQEAVRRRVASRRPQVPPIGGILTTPLQAATPLAASVTSAPPTETPCEAQSGNRQEQESLASRSKEQLMDLAYEAVKGISSVVNATNKLTHMEKGVISSFSQDILAAVAALNIRLAEQEHAVTAMKLQVASMELKVASAGAGVSCVAPPPGLTQGVVSYASKLKLPKGKPEMELKAKGPAVLFYPASESIKTSEETKKELQKAVQPGSQGIQVQGIRRVGNAGVVVQTASAEAARKLKEAAPPTLKVTDPKSRRPLVAIRNLRKDHDGEKVMQDLHAINLAEFPEWNMKKLRESCKVAFKKGRRGGRTTVVLECTPQLRDTLIHLGKVYIAWDEAEVCDYIRVTCCNKCQQYGHPEKFCRSSDTVCGKCGEAGHRAQECKSEKSCCATCKRFKRPEAASHSTAALDCPARLYAEQQAGNMTQWQ